MQHESEVNVEVVVEGLPFRKARKFVHMPEVGALGDIPAPPRLRLSPDPRFWVGLTAKRIWRRKGNAALGESGES